ncbi:MAG: hypothetical protein AB1347_05305 [Acidobacteriota bacterium]
MGPNPIAKGIGLIVSGVVFILALFLKLCFTTALYATLAEIQRRVQVYKANRRPPVRAILLIPVVILFVSAVLFLISVPRFIFGTMNLQALRGLQINPMTVVWIGLRFGFLLAALVLGLVLGLMIGRGFPVLKDRFGGVLVASKGAHLTFWTAAFALAGFFRLMPWGIVTYWTVWLLVLAACLVMGAHYSLYGSYREAYARTSAGLGSGDPIRLDLDAGEAVVLSAILGSRGALTEQALAHSLRAPDASLLAHPAWAERAHALASDPAALGAVLSSLATRGLAGKSAQGWGPAGASLRLRSAGFCDRAAALTVKGPSGSRTRVVQWLGPSRLLLEPGPLTLTLRELVPGDSLPGLLAGE